MWGRTPLLGAVPASSIGNWGGIVQDCSSGVNKQRRWRENKSAHSLSLAPKPLWETLLVDSQLGQDHSRCLEEEQWWKISQYFIKENQLNK